MKHFSHGVERLTEIARRLDVDRATVHRIIKTLQGNGLISQDPSMRKYYLGPPIQTLAENPIMVHRIVVQLALSEMVRNRFLLNVFTH